MTYGGLSLLDYFNKDSKNPFLTNLDDMGLKGDIWIKNSDPRIKTSNVARMKQLDDILGDWAEKNGVRVLYTSAMGGKHKAGSGHYSGDKVDVQFFKGGKQVELPKELEKQLETLGYYGGKTGAVGREKQDNGGFHHDLFIGDIESRIMGKQSSSVSTTTNNRSLTVNVRDEKQANSVMDNFLYNPAVQYALT